jgi:hypothetical protein
MLVELVLVQDWVYWVHLSKMWCCYDFVLD